MSSLCRAGGLALERLSLLGQGCSVELAQCIQLSRRPSTLKSYDRHWKNFSSWCLGKCLSSSSCAAVRVLDFLRDGFVLGLAVSTLRAQWAAILAFRGSSVSCVSPLMARLLWSFLIQRPVSHSPVLAWDLPLVLQALTGPPFEPLLSVDLKFLSAKVLFLVAITSGRRVGELGALMASPPFLRFCSDKVILRPNQFFLPKVLSSLHCQEDIVLPVFFPDPSSPEEVVLHSLDVLRALRIYLERTSDFRTVDSLFVSYGLSGKGLRPSLSTLSHWVKGAVVSA